MNKDLKVSKSILINASIEAVWDAMVNPKKIEQYLFGTQTNSDWKVGSLIAFTGEYQGQIYKDKGIVTVNESNANLEYRYWSGFSGLPDLPENYCLVGYVFEEIGPNEVKLTWNQTGFSSEQGHQHTEKTLPDMLENIKKIVEG